jgi:nicotinic acid mononucleotide adenylyltransferase
VRHFGLSRLLVRVVADPGHKTVSTPADVRLALATLAFADVPGAEVSLDPHARTVDSLEELALDDPVFLVGADEFASFLEWKRPQRILQLARLGVATRPGYSLDLLEPVLERLERPDRVEQFAIDPHTVSSSAVRQLTADGAPLDEVVPRAVADEVRRLGLYRPRPDDTGGG